MLNLVFRLILILISIINLQCLHNTTGGGGSEVEVVGYVYLCNNEPAPATQVKLIPCDYDPSIRGNIPDSLIDTTDNKGRYSFKNIEPGIYNIYGLQLNKRTKMLLTGVKVVKETTTIVPDGILLETATLRILLPGGTTQEGYITIPGTDIYAFIPKGRKEVILDSIPATTLPELKYRSLNNSEQLSKFNITVSPATTTFVVSFTSKYLKQIQLNTSPSGAAIRGNVYNFPILIRLTSSNFDFSSAKENGEDIRFTKVDGTLLPYEIERWSKNENKAEIWVKVDTIYGNDSTQKIIMYWGDEKAQDSSNSKSVFDTSAGFVGVWHLSENEGNYFHDATGNRYDGLSPDTSLPSKTEGIIGNSRNFDGINDRIMMPNTANSKLNFPQDGFFTVSAWVNVDTFDYVYRTILTKGFEQYFLQLSYFPGNKPLWQFSVFREEDNWNMSHTDATELKKWVFLTGVREGTTQRLYCNGELVAEVSAVYDQNTSKITTNDFSIGSFLQEATFPAKFGYCYFKGKIDEVRVCSMSRDPDWIKLSYMNQKEEDKLILFK